VVTLLYDGDCAFCTRMARLGTRLVPSVALRPLQSVDLEDVGVDEPRAQTEIPFVTADGAVSYGSDGIANALIANGRRTAWIGRLLLTRPVRPIARRVYRFVARHRHRLPGGSAACELPQ